MNLIEILDKGVGVQGVTDIHLVVGMLPQMRVRGELVTMKGFRVVTEADTRGYLEKFLDLKARGELKGEGQVDISYEIQGGLAGERGGYVPVHSARFRVNVYQTQSGVSWAFRVLSKNVAGVSELGTPFQLQYHYKSRRGLILVTGVTGSGKSTTLAAFIDLINENLKKHIITLEDPIEYVHKGKLSIVSQREIGVDVDSFERGLRGVLRQDPDVILIGELRDEETMDIALKSAETGHLVCATLHTMGVVETINRVLGMFPYERAEQIRMLLADVLSVVVCQQLLPKKGGGVILAYEYMEVDAQVKGYILRGEQEKLGGYLRSDEARARQMVSMDDSILELWKKGLISSETAVEYSYDKGYMRKKIYK